MEAYNATQSHCTQDDMLLYSRIMRIINFHALKTITYFTLLHKIFFRNILWALQKEVLQNFYIKPNIKSFQVSYKVLLLLAISSNALIVWQVIKMSQELMLYVVIVFQPLIHFIQTMKVQWSKKKLEIKCSTSCS